MTGHIPTKSEIETRSRRIILYINDQTQTTDTITQLVKDYIKEHGKISTQKLIQRQDTGYCISQAANYSVAAPPLADFSLDCLMKIRKAISDSTRSNKDTLLTLIDSTIG